MNSVDKKLAKMLAQGFLEILRTPVFIGAVICGAITGFLGAAFFGGPAFAPRPNPVLHPNTLPLNVLLGGLACGVVTLILRGLMALVYRKARRYVGVGFMTGMIGGGLGAIVGHPLGGMLLGALLTPFYALGTGVFDRHIT